MLFPDDSGLVAAGSPEPTNPGAWKERLSNAHQRAIQTKETIAGRYGIKDPERANRIDAARRRARKGKYSTSGPGWFPFRPEDDDGEETSRTRYLEAHARATEYENRTPESMQFQRDFREWMEKQKASLDANTKALQDSTAANQSAPVMPPVALRNANV